MQTNYLLLLQEGQWDLDAEHPLCPYKGLKWMHKASACFWEQGHKIFFLLQNLLHPKALHSLCTHGTHWWAAGWQLTG